MVRTCLLGEPGPVQQRQLRGNRWRAGPGHPASCHCQEAPEPRVSDTHSRAEAAAMKLLPPCPLLSPRPRERCPPGLAAMPAAPSSCDVAPAGTEPAPVVVLLSQKESQEMVVVLSPFLAAATTQYSGPTGAPQPGQPCLGCWDHPPNTHSTVGPGPWIPDAAAGGGVSGPRYQQTLSIRAPPAGDPAHPVLPRKACLASTEASSLRGLGEPWALLGSLTAS